jgi:hypothetical protein
MLRWLEVEWRERDTKCRPGPVQMETESIQEIKVSLPLLEISYMTLAYSAVEIPSSTAESPSSEVHRRRSRCRETCQTARVQIVCRSPCLGDRGREPEVETR